LTYINKEHFMKMGRSITLGALAAGALALGSAAFAQEAKQPKTETKPEATHEHRGEHGRHGMHRMSGEQGGCHGQQEQSGGDKPAGEHKHS
jgi:hypothetical protein